MSSAQHWVAMRACIHRWRRKWRLCGTGSAESRELEECFTAARHGYASPPPSITQLYEAVWTLLPLDLPCGEEDR